ncbi:OmpA family protein [Lentisphaerota bacterium WC36G]|nr:OmpA family protein [Lentisphaerae bacterium WC36]
MKKLYIYGLSVFVAVLLSGCGIFSNEDGEDPTDPVDGGIATMNDGLGADGLGADIDPGSNGGWGNEGDLANKQGDWTPYKDNLNFPTIYFGYDQDALTASEKAELDRVAAYMQQYAQVGVIIEGHCDERGSAEYNRSLGERRAISVKNYLVQQGVPESRVRTLSYGEERPAVEGFTAEIFAKNRRAELVPAKMN